ncbi:hypothetical protein COO60DRAFT_1561066, partial [Scenedesmus sp. NREL 46B-D3]
MFLVSCCFWCCPAAAAAAAAVACAHASVCVLAVKGGQVARGAVSLVAGSWLGRLCGGGVTALVIILQVPCASAASQLQLLLVYVPVQQQQHGSRGFTADCCCRALYML